MSAEGGSIDSRSRVWLFLEAGVAGLVAALAFPLVLSDLGEAPLLDFMPRELGIFVAAALLFRVATDRASVGRRMLASLIAGLVHFAVLLYWLDIAMTHYGGMPAWQALPALSLLLLVCAAFWAALPPILDELRRSPRLDGALGFALAVIFLEWLRGVIATGFPWGLWGYSQTRNRPLLALASLGGVYAISWVIATTGALLARAWAARRTAAGRGALARLVGFVVAAHVVGALVALGHADDQGEGIRVTLVQGNIEQTIKNEDGSHRDEILDRYLDLTKTAEEAGADLILWPEGAWPGRTNAELKRMPELKGTHTPILLGASAYEWQARQVHAFNSAFFVGPGGFNLARYDKQHLVPFGEYVPLRFILPVEKFVTGLVDYSAGTSAAPIGRPPIGVLICYDGIFPSIARAEVESGAQVLANLTNDAWYGVSSAAYQHRDFYIMRAVETDRWVMRVANTGLSLVVSPTGELRGQSGLNRQALVRERVFTRTTRTAYVRFGDWLPAVAIGTVLGAFGRALTRRLPRSKRPIDNTGASGAEQAGPRAPEQPPEPPPTLQ